MTPKPKKEKKNFFFEKMKKMKKIKKKNLKN